MSRHVHTYQGKIQHLSQSKLNGKLPLDPSPELEEPGTIGDIENPDDGAPLRSCGQLASTWVESNGSKTDFKIQISFIEIQQSS